MATEGQTWTWYNREKVQCECGLTVHRTDGHVRSVYHRQHRRILALLRQPCISASEIAKRVGVSRERIRQLENLVGEPNGRQRQAVCSINKWVERRNARLERKKQHPHMKELAEICAKHGLSLEMLFTQGAVKNVKVNGHVCSVHRTYEYGTTYASYVRIRFPQKPKKFTLFRHTDRWFVIPAHVAKDLGGDRATAFSLQPDIRYGAKSMRHNYMKYANAWHLLEAK